MRALPLAATALGILAACVRGQENLGDVDKEQLRAARELLQEFGADAWPGFDRPLPIILYDRESQYLVGMEAPTQDGWRVVGTDDLDGAAYFRRPSRDTASFAVRVGESWTGSLQTLASMRSEMAQQRGFSLELPAEEHVVYLCHELFHALQATREPTRFAGAVASYGHEADYPYDDEEFVESWNEEGQLLAEALAERDPEGMAEVAEEFLDARRARREEAALSAELIAFEQHLEWLEGLAKYVELRLCELAGEEHRAYRLAGNRLRSDFGVRLRSLGTLPGQQRFYLSGAAQALLLDRLRPEWKEKGQGERPLEDLLTSRGSGR